MRKATIEYYFNDETINDLVFKQGISFHGENYDSEAKETYEQIDEEFTPSFLNDGNHLFDLYIDGDLMETFTCEEETANQILEKYFLHIPLEGEESQ